MKLPGAASPLVTWTCRLLSLGRHPSTAVRLRFYFWAACLIGSTLNPARVLPIAAGGWLITNLVLGFTGLVWAAFHPRLLARTAALIAGWAGWVAVPGTISITGLATVAAVDQMAGVYPSAGNVVLAAIGLPIFLVLFTACLLVGLVGASVGASAFNTPEAQSVGARHGVLSAWLITLLAMPLWAAGEGAVWWASALIIGVPQGVRWLGAFLARPGQSPEELAGRARVRLEQHLVWLRPTGLGRTADFRGAALGLLCAAGWLVLHSSQLVRPLQGRLFVSLLRSRDNLALLQMGEGWDREWQSGGPGPAVLELDEPARRKALAKDGSEAALLADIVPRLTRFGAWVVVLTPPLAADLAGSLLTPDLLFGTNGDRLEDAARRNLRDLPSLEDALRTSGRVVLGVCSLPRASEVHLTRLRAAARGSGRADVASFVVPEVPVVDLSLGERRPLMGSPAPVARLLPLPLVIHARCRPNPVPVMPEVLEGRGALVDERLVSFLDERRILVDVPGGLGDGQLPVVTYSSLLAATEPGPEPILVSGSRWTDPALFFKDRVVIVDSLLSRRRPTPQGERPLSHVLAYATAALHQPAPVRPLSPQAWVALNLCLGVLAGILAGGREPLRAGAIGVLGLVSLVLVCSAAILGGMWVDPVVPCGTVLTATLLVSQFTYHLAAKERGRTESMLRRFVAPQIVDELMAEWERGGERPLLGGTRRQVCILFADIRGFTPYAASKQPEEVLATTNAYLTAMTAAVLRHGGLLDKYLGDGLMALFRMEGSGRDEVTRCVRSALDIQKASRRVSQERVEAGLEPLAVGIGIHCGEAVVGLVGNPEQVGYTALGHTVVVAQRLQTQASPGEILVSDAVAELVGSDFALEAGAPLQVKGLATPITCLRVPNEH